MESKYVELIKNNLGDGVIHLSYDGYSNRTFAAEMLHFLLFFCLSIGLLYRKIFLVDDMSEQVYWDLLLASGLFLWSAFVLLRALLLRPKKGDGLRITSDGVAKISDEKTLIQWEQISTIYPFPWFVGVKSKNKQALWIGFFFKRFSQVSKLFELLASVEPKSTVKSAIKDAEIKSILKSLRQQTTLSP